LPQRDKTTATAPSGYLSRTAGDVLARTPHVGAFFSISLRFRSERRRRSAPMAGSRSRRQDRMIAPRVKSVRGANLSFPK
jgi:hypothetical protein